jgi:hypothetical protein
MSKKGQDNNILVLQFAAVLEALENNFYQQGIQKFSAEDFQNAGFSATSIVDSALTTIQNDEAAHLKFLSNALNALGSSPPDSCQFNFDSVLTDVPTMAAVARVVELVGVGAYSGAANLITDPQILTAAATILTVEARHQTLLNVMSSTGSSIPQAFDIALTPSEVLAIAGSFISGCDLGIPSNPPLKVTNSGTPNIGTTLTFDFDGKGNSDNLHCQMLVGGAVNSIALPMKQCTVPPGINGPVALFITSDNQPLANNVIDRQSANSIVAGPTIAFIDSVPEPLSQLVRAPAGGSASSGSNQVSVAPQAGPNFSTGSEAGGAVIVNGWTNLPNGEQPPASGDSSNNNSQGSPLSVTPAPSSVSGDSSNSNNSQGSPLSVTPAPSPAPGDSSNSNNSQGSPLSVTSAPSPAPTPSTGGAGAMIISSS